MKAALLAVFMGWAPADKAMFAVNVGCHAVDYAQTSWAMEHGYSEMNPWLGENPSNTSLVAFKLLGGAGTYLAARRPENRTAVLMGLTALCLGVIGHNYNEGARP